MFSHHTTFEAQRRNLEWFWSSVKTWQKQQEDWLHTCLENAAVPVDETARAHFDRWLQIFKKGCNQAEDSGNALLKAWEARMAD